VAEVVLVTISLLHFLLSILSPMGRSHHVHSRASHPRGYSVYIKLFGILLY
jgi:hypothetical protein